MAKRQLHTEGPGIYLIIRGQSTTGGASERALTDGFTGKDKYIQFYEGFGILDLVAIHLERPDWVQLVAGEYKQVAGETPEQYVDYWRQRGFRVMEITAEEAAEFRAKAAVCNDARQKFYRGMDALYEHRKNFLVVA